MWPKLILLILFVVRTGLIQLQINLCLNLAAKIFLIILASFSDSLDSLKIDWSAQLLFSAIHEGPFHQMYGILLNKPPLLLKPAVLFGTSYIATFQCSFYLFYKIWGHVCWGKFQCRNYEVLCRDTRFTNN